MELYESLTDQIMHFIREVWAYARHLLKVTPVLFSLDQFVSFFGEQD
jgi:hypothetical protein